MGLHQCFVSLDVSGVRADTIFDTIFGGHVCPGAWLMPWFGGHLCPGPWLTPWFGGHVCPGTWLTPSLGGTCAGGMPADAMLKADMPWGPWLTSPPPPVTNKKCVLNWVLFWLKGGGGADGFQHFVSERPAGTVCS